MDNLRHFLEAQFCAADGSADLGGGRSICNAILLPGRSKTARATLKAYIVLVTAISGSRVPPGLH
jgi:hypothetical protein